jgi:AcrR family transcriptional regulator
MSDRPRDVRALKSDKERNGEAPAHSARRDLVAEAILAKAAELFADQGVQGTGIREIAEAMDMSRPAVYHYFSSKDALIEQLLEDYTGNLVGFLRGIRQDSSLSVSEKLTQFVTGLAMRVAAKPAHLRLAAGSERSLPAAMARDHADARHEAFDHVVAIIAEGIETGEIRPVDERVVAFALFGMCHWIAWWYQPGGSATDEQIAREMTNIALHGLLRPAPRNQGSGIQHAIELLREDLDYLERHTGSKARKRSL